MNPLCGIGFCLFAAFGVIQTSEHRWIPFSGSEYSLAPEKMTQHQGIAFCRKHGADLVYISSAEENVFVKRILSSPDAILSVGGWIGLSYLTGEGFRWSNGQYLVFESWASNEPKQDEIGKPCTYMYRGKWRAARCTESHKVVCQRPEGLVTPTPKTDPVTTPRPGYCPSGYTDVGNKCFRMFRPSLARGRTLSWNEALTRCRQEPGFKPDLASFHSALENAYLTAQLMDKSQSLWIGMARDGVTTFWSDNSPVSYKNIEFNEESHYCVAMQAAEPSLIGMWNWNDCSDKMNYICQTFKDGSISIPPPSTSPMCEEGFHFYQGNCYSFTSTPSTWDTASELCSQQGAHLTVIHSPQENAALQILSQGKPAWIGFRKTGGGQYEWSNGWYALYTDWGKDEPGNQGGCVQMMDDGKWSDKPCDKKQAFLCEIIGDEPPITTPTPLEGRCPPEGGWEPFGGHCYLFKQGHDTWFDAHMNCKQEDEAASIVSIHNVVENDWIFQQTLKPKSGLWAPPQVWIGLHMSKKDQLFRWADGSPIQYTNWAINHPNQKQCVMIKNGGSLWKDVDCHFKGGYVCKIKKRSLYPTTPTEGPGKCPSAEWTSYGWSCFLFKPDNLMKWQSAEAFCATQGGHLSSLRDQNEQDFVYQAMLDNTHLPQYSPYWLGATRGTEERAVTQFKWIDGTGMPNAYWGNAYPNEDQGADCLSVHQDTRIWQNVNCDLLAGFVCRAEKVQPTPDIRMSNNQSNLTGGLSAPAIAIALVALVASVAVIAFLLWKKITSSSRQEYNSLERLPVRPDVGS